MGSKFSNDEERAFKYLFDDRLSAAAASEELKKEGIDMSPVVLRNFKRKSFQLLVDEQKDEYLSDMLIDSYTRVKLEFEDLNAKTKALLAKFEKEGKSFGQLETIRELKDQLVIVMKLMGKFESGMEKVTLKQQNIYNLGNFMESFRKIRETEFDQMDYVESNGTLTILNPSPELLDDFQKWQRNKAKEITVLG
jgi:hypothetical protein